MTSERDTLIASLRTKIDRVTELAESLKLDQCDSADLRELGGTYTAMLEGLERIRQIDAG